MKDVQEQQINILLSLPVSLNEKLQAEAEKQCRKRRGQIIFILEKFFAASDGNAEKEEEK